MVKKGIEDLGQGLGVHPLPRVAHRQLDVGPRLNLGMVGGVFLVQINLADLDLDVPAAGHGIPGIDHQVHEDLVHLRDVGLDGTGVARIVNIQDDVLPDAPLQDGFGFPDHFRQVHRVHGQHLFAGKGQQLPGQIPGLHGGLQDLLQVVPVGVIRIHVQLQQFRVHDDGRQEVVEIVGHASSQGADAFHLAGLVQLLFQLAGFFLGAQPLFHLLLQTGVGLLQAIAGGHQVLGAPVEFVGQLPQLVTRRIVQPPGIAFIQGGRGPHLPGQLHDGPHDGAPQDHHHDQQGQHLDCQGHKEPPAGSRHRPPR